MSQRRQMNLIAFPALNPRSKLSRLSSVTCKPLRVPLSVKCSSLIVKAARLELANPSAAELIEKLVDDLLAEVS